MTDNKDGIEKPDGNEIHAEYPEGAHFLEMMLVDMLAENARSWNCLQRIGGALSTVRRKAELLREEKNRWHRSDVQGQQERKPQPLIRKEEK